MVSSLIYSSSILQSTSIKSSHKRIRDAFKSRVGSSDTTDSPLSQPSPSTRRILGLGIRKSNRVKSTGAKSSGGANKVEGGTILISQKEWAECEAAANAHKDAWAAALAAKRSEWMELKSSGVLERLSSSDLIDAEMIDDLDKEIQSKRAIRRLKGKIAEGGAVHAVSEAPLLVDPEKLNEHARSELANKLAIVSAKKTGSALATFNLLNEIKDKGLLETKLVESTVMALITRFDSEQLAISAFRMYLQWLDSGLIVESSPLFKSHFVNTCFANNLVNVAQESMKLLLSPSSNAGGATTTRNIKHCIDDEMLTSNAFLPGLVCEVIYKCQPPHEMSIKATNHNGYDGSVSRLTRECDDKNFAELGQMLMKLKGSLHSLPISDINLVVRTLGRRRFVDEIFTLLDDMRSVRKFPNDETLEFLANAMVAGVSEQATATSMKDLPKPDVKIPEIVFAGRSNVGKSSLVNCLVNRKALASTSSTPGHTTQFHFFSVNKDRRDLPSFYLVDVPGLGYAEATAGMQDSWRSLLERYLTVRDSLGAVFHLVDSRHKITPTDEQLIAIATRAAISRKANGLMPFQYVIILTKADKASPKALKDSERDCREKTKVLAEELQNCNSQEGKVPIIVTSSIEKTGKDQVWQVLQSVIR